MRRGIPAALLAALLPLGATAQGLDTTTYQSCMSGCDAALDACCVQGCAYQACIAAGAGGTSLFSGLGAAPGDMPGGETLADPAAAQAAVAACMPHVDALQKCRAAEAAARARTMPAAPEPTPFIALDCCRYWLEDRAGKQVVRGWYLGGRGQKIDYRSEPVHPLSLAGTANGMFALTSGIGYHIYFVDEGNPAPETALVYVTRFGPDRVENLYILRIAGRFYVRLAEDMSSGHVVYNTPDAPDAFYELPLD